MRHVQELGLLTLYRTKAAANFFIQTTVDKGEGIRSLPPKERVVLELAEAVGERSYNWKDKIKVVFGLVEFLDVLEALKAPTLEKEVEFAHFDQNKIPTVTVKVKDFQKDGGKVMRMMSIFKSVGEKKYNISIVFSKSEVRLLVQLFPLALIKTREPRTWQAESSARSSSQAESGGEEINLGDENY